jgi:adenylylsulfate kinase
MEVVMEAELVKPKNVVWFDGYLGREERELLHGHKGAVVWFTGLSASGKSTIAQYLERVLYARNCSTYVLDGDNVRHGLCSDLGFSAADRAENIRRIGEMARLFVDGGVIVLTAFISPYREDRERVRGLVGDERFIEVYVECPVDVCAERDPKGMYAKAKAGVIKEFTGISAPYEPPKSPCVTIRSDLTSVREAGLQILHVLGVRGIIKRGRGVKTGTR